jgi:hypothetical protein
MVLKPQDIFIQLKILAMGPRKWSFVLLANELGMSASEIHAGVQRAVAARLMDPSRKAPVRGALEEFLVHGLKYSFPPERGGLVRGLPTGYAAPPLLKSVAQPAEPPPVWPDPDGSVQGMAFSPLYRTAPLAARRDPALYELLALVDAVRGGRARERNLAIRELKKRLGP